jgi:hypothetical protein
MPCRSQGFYLRVAYLGLGGEVCPCYLLSLALPRLFEADICEHRGILRNAHHLCRLGYGRDWELSGEAGGGNRRSSYRIFLLNEAVRLKLGQWAIRSSTN